MINISIIKWKNRGGHMQYFHSDMDLEFVLTENTDVTFEKHNHVSKYVAGLILSGAIEIVENNKKIECQMDDIFVIPIYAVHSLHFKNKATRILTMCVGMQFIEKYLEAEGKSVLNHYTDELQKQNVINDKQAIAFEDAMDIIIKYYNEEETIFPMHINNIKQIIISESEQELRLEYLAKQIYISKYYLIRKFKENIGLTPHNFQIQNRIRKSQHLLSEGWRISDAAAESGFYDQSHFIKCFKNILGITPSEYIDSLKKLE